MSRSQRRLLLPMAAVGLSEADARLGHAEAASESAELAYHVSMLTSTFTVLIQAVRLFPDVQRRQLARSPGDSRWHRLVVAPSVRRHAPAVQPAASGATLVLQPFGRERDLIIDGEPARLTRAFGIGHRDAVRDYDETRHQTSSHFSDSRVAALMMPAIE